MLAELADRVVWDRVRFPRLSIAPPQAAVLVETVLVAITAEPDSTQMPPPATLAELPVSLELFRVSVPVLSMPPP